jgi:integrase
MAGYRKRTSNGTEYWELTWRQAGKSRSQSLGAVANLREGEVREIARRKARELAIAEHAAPTHRRRFVDFCADYLSWHADEYPHSNQRVDQIVTQHLLPAFTGTLHGITQIDVERYKAQRLKAQAAPGTVTKELRTLRAILNRAVKLGELTRNVADLVKAPRSLNQRKGFAYFTTAELQRIYAKGTIEAWHRYAWMFYAGSGARRMEGLNLKWSDVGSDTLHLVSTGEERTKSGLARDVPISEGVREALTFFSTWEQRSDLYVLPRVHPASLSRIAARCIRRAGLTGSLHTLRHTFVSHLAMDARIPVLAIKEWAGHSTLAVTEKYMHHRPSVTDDLLRSMRF